MAPSNPHSKDLAQSTIGQLGENLVSQWLQKLGWEILEQRWKCRWGELDIVAKTQEQTPTIVMVEVKVRSRGNWDSDGLLAITSQKQAKLLQAADLFLAEHPSLHHCPCRFDIALVKRDQNTRVQKHYGETRRTTGVALEHSYINDTNVLKLEEAISGLTGSSSAPTQAMQSLSAPSLTVGNETFTLQTYIEAAFDAG